MIATMLGVFVGAFPSVILVASLPEITEDLDASKAAIAWVIALPMLVASVMLPTFGRLGDLRGQRRVFLFGLVACGGFALASAFAWDATSLIVLRTLSQTAGMATTPTAIAMIMEWFPVDRRPRALGVWAFVSAGSPAMGLVFGGPIVAAMGWRGIFVLQAAVAVVFLPACLRWTKETVRRHDVGFDIPGGIALMVASGAVLLFFDRGSQGQWTNGWVLMLLVVAPVAAFAFTRIERRAAFPLLPQGLLRNRAYAAPVAGEFLTQLSSSAVFFGAPLMLKDRFGLSVGEIALTMLPLPLGMCAGALAGGRAAARLGERTAALIGSVAMAASMLLFLIGFEFELFWLVVVALIVQGIANGYVRPAAASAGGHALDPEYFGVGMATMRMIALLGSTAGISIEVVAYSLGGFRAVFLTSFACAALATVAMSMVISRRLPSVTSAEERERQERELIDEMETDTALTTLPAFEG